MATRLHLDFESASEADLKKVGTSQYARHPSSRVLMLAYAFGDEEVEQWIPEQGPMPERLRAALTDPEYVKIAWNKTFEYAIFKHVLGIEIPHDQWRDSMVLAFSLSLPGSLDKAGKVVGLPLEQQKLSRGKNLIRKFCVPRKPTKTKPWTWNTAETDPADWEEFKLYNRQDVEAERAIWKRLRKWNMPAHEWRLWFLDQEINERGIPINRRVVENAIRLAQEVTSARLAEMSEITGLDNPNSGAQLLPWLREEGYRFDDLKKGHVDTALKEAQADDVGLFDPDYARVLELRQEVSKASVKKYAAISAALDPDDRLRHTLQFAGAGRTWRWSGRRFQPQNLARPVWYLEKTQEQAVRHLERLDPESIELLYPKPMDLLSTCVRPVVQAPEGFLLIDADLNAIENRVVGWLAGDKKILRVFEEGRCPYLDFATKMFVQPYDVLFAEYKAGNKFKRTQAKPAVLGCFGEDTLVLTDSGWKRIVEVQPDDLVHDGEEFVRHEGVVNRGRKKVLCMSGVYVTPDHEIAVGEDSWVEAGSVGPSQFQKALALANGLLRKNWTQLAAQVVDTAASVRADASKSSRGRTLSGPNQPNASPARYAVGGTIPASALAPSFMTASPIVSMRSDLAAKTPTTNTITTTVRAELNAVSQVVRSLFDTLLKNSGSESQTKSTGSTTTDTTKEETSAPQPDLFRTATGEIVIESNMPVKSSALRSSGGASPLRIARTVPSLESGETGYQPSKSSTTSGIAEVRTTYDIVNAGPRHRFVILTDDGPIIVHNCGYMLGGGEEKENPQTGEIEATGLLGYAWSLGVRDMTRERSHESVRVWRETYTDVVEYWWELDRAARRCIQTGETTRARHLTFDRSGPFMRMILPSGRALHYCRPKLIMKETPWGEMKEQISYEGLNDTNHWSRITTHPGKLVENATQAVARDLLAHGMMLAHQRGLDIFMHVHDQIVGMAPIDRAEDDLEVLRECMSEQPDWAKDMPLAAEGFVSPVFLKD